MSESTTLSTNEQVEASHARSVTVCRWGAASMSRHESLGLPCRDYGVGEPGLKCHSSAKKDADSTRDKPLKLWADASVCKQTGRNLAQKLHPDA